jgi:hypothetical protein
MNKESESIEHLAVKTSIKAGAFETMEFLQSLGESAKGSMSDLMQGAESIYSYRSDYLPRITFGSGN